MSKDDNPGLLKSLLPNEVLEFGSPVPELEPCSLEYLFERYVQFLCKKSIKTLTVILFLIIMTLCIWNVTRLADGLDLSDIVPHRTKEHEFLKAQEQYFGFYNMYAVTRDNFEYPTNQKLLYDYHNAFTRVPFVVKNDNGGLPQFWLGMFRDWLIGLQKAFDRDWTQGFITQEGWLQNATDEGILAYKLMVQTGYADKPVDKSQVPQTRLVDDKGIINPEGFYNYLSAWVGNDLLAYSSSQANLKPEPKPWSQTANDYQLEIPKALPLMYAQIPFNVQGLSSTSRVTSLIAQVRDLCAKFEARGLPNFASGIPFLFWEHYLKLRLNATYGILCALGIVFCVVALLLLNAWAASLITFSVAVMVLQVLGLFSLLNIRLSAISAALGIITVGINTHYVAHTCMSFLTAIGNREKRLELAVKHMFPTILYGALAMMLAVTMLLINQFDFIIRYFFYMLMVMNVVGVVNGTLFFPVLLLLVGPSAEVKPLEYPDRICTPSPEPIRRSRKGNSHRGSSAPTRRQRQPSLSTITEEPGSWDSATHEIVVEPELIVETTFRQQPPQTEGNTNGNENEGSCHSSPTSVHRMTANPSTSASANATPGSGHITAKVTATATFKVEVHTPIHGSFERSNSHRHGNRRRDSTSSTSTTSTEYSMKH